MDIFQATKLVRQHILQTINAETTVQTSGIVAYGQGEFLHFNGVNDAVHQCGGNGWIFKYLYRNGQVELTPVS